MKTLALLGFAEGAVFQRRQAQGTATVRLAEPSGVPQQLASNFIYGIVDNVTARASVSTAIPDLFYTGIGFNACRAGGAQLVAPNRGWAFGENEYVGRFASTLSNYLTTRKLGGDFILLVHDLWGADSLEANTIAYPGDSGDWSSFGRFYDRLFSDLRANNMIDGVVVDIWNEPDIGSFWARSSPQYLDYYGRAHRRLRAEFSALKISGPSLSQPASTSATTWQQWTSYVAANDLIPDIYSWHQLVTSQDPASNLQAFESLRTQNNLPVRPIDINEYAAPEEQIPSTSAWYISRFERLNLRGLRANWAGFGDLHDFLANVVGKNGTEYFPNGEWQLYKYYGGMTGTRVATSGSADGGFDVFATKGDVAKSVKVLAGNMGNTRTYDITINGPKSVGLPASGKVDIRTFRFDWNGRFGKIGAPVDLGVYSHQYSGDQVTFWVTTETANTAYAFEFA
ncbi:glycoside hydrolase superfamily [Elsinoe ampelina]|uniref:Glycoside hydrolase superfamily n=1 Tax=Elsinoe ampelina TaxID=302913 RepID=A0A6A6GEH7_9PEZI|nr:glycoside hydrolase superfamily [Elsinoe ampelina]